MSLLLDALKKASEEKAKKQAADEAGQSSNEPIKDNEGEDTLSQVDIHQKADNSDFHAQSLNHPVSKVLSEQEGRLGDEPLLELDEDLIELPEPVNALTDQERHAIEQDETLPELVNTPATKDEVDEPADTPNASLILQSKTSRYTHNEPIEEAEASDASQESEPIKPSVVDSTAHAAQPVFPSASSRYSRPTLQARRRRWLGDWWWALLLLVLLLFLLIGYAIKVFWSEQPEQILPLNLPGQSVELTPDEDSGDMNIDWLLEERLELPVETPKAKPVKASKTKMTRHAARKPRSVSKRSARAKPAQLNIARQPMPKTLMDYLESGYAAYQKKDWFTAQSEYQRAIAMSKDNRDAQLGLAATAMRRAQFEQAQYWYRQVLKSNPKDSVAHAGLIAADERIAEQSTASDIQQAIADTPSSAPLYFSLGNEYAQKGLWKRAQAQYFQALALAPNHPDYAYNLAISLDHLGKRAQALQYYEQAKQFMAQYPNGINLTALKVRVEQLKQEVAQ